MPLTDLDCDGNTVSDLSPLVGMPLTVLSIDSKFVPIFTAKRDEPNRCLLHAGEDHQGLGRTPPDEEPQVSALRGTRKFSPAEFWKKYDAGEFGKPAAPGKLAYLAPAFQQWVKATQALPAEQQVEAVSNKLMELNPGFDGKMAGWEEKDTPKIDRRVVTELGFLTDNVTDISPVRALVGLKRLSCGGTFRSGRGYGILPDLSPLAGMQLTAVNCSNNASVFDLSPLAGMPLTWLGCGATNVFDLSPLKGMKITVLYCSTTQVSDLSPLVGMPLTKSASIRLRSPTSRRYKECPW